MNKCKYLFALSNLMFCTLTFASTITESVSLYHGTPSYPISRQQLCFNGQDYHWPVDGSLIKNEGCRVAYQHNYLKYKSKIESESNLIEQAGYPFTQKDEFSKNILDYPMFDNKEKLKTVIPDGTICSGGNIGQEKDIRKDYLWNDKSGMDVVTTWTASNVKPNKKGDLDIVYHATATHNPSFFEVYLSSAEYKSSERPLKWSDLSLLKKIDNPTLVGSDYKFSVPLNNEKGTRVLFIRWQRIDTVGEGFYSCSDINIE